MMTVAELISALEALPPDAPVIVRDLFEAGFRNATSATLTEAAKRHQRPGDRSRPDYVTAGDAFATDVHQAVVLIDY